jgi:glycerol-3-phosphate dehydrogenase (NAD(P)+)
MTEKIGVIGAGAWGTALAMLLADNGHDVTLWMYEQDLATETVRTRENPHHNVVSRDRSHQ